MCGDLYMGKSATDLVSLHEPVTLSCCYSAVNITLPAPVLHHPATLFSRLGDFNLCVSQLLHEDLTVVMLYCAVYMSWGER